MSSLISSPMDIFPAEILRLIFEHGAELEQIYRHSPFLLRSMKSPSKDCAYSPAFQITVSHVCRRWRNIAEKTPSLWHTLHFTKFSDIERARVFLRRCASSSFLHANSTYPPGYLLDILILTRAVKPEELGQARPPRQKDDELSKPDLEDIFELLIQHTARWRSFHLSVQDNPCKFVARQALGRDCGRAPNLETLQLYHFKQFDDVHDLHEATVREPVKCFENHAPKLKHVSLIGVNLPWDDSPYLEGLETLQLALHLDRVRPSYTVWSRILSGSPELKTLILHYSGPKTRDQDWPASDDTLRSRGILLANVEHLSLIGMEPDYTSRILERLHLPSVKVLSLNLDSDAGDHTEFVLRCIGESEASPSNDIVGLGPALLPCLRNLTSLALTELECSLPAFKLLLSTACELEELDIDFKYIALNPGEPWEVFAPSDEKQPLLLPNLRVFKMRHICGSDVESIIKYRELYDHERHPGKVLSYSTSANPIRLDPTYKQRSKYVVMYNEKGMDEKLKELIKSGCCFPIDDNIAPALHSPDNSAGRLRELEGQLEGSDVGAKAEKEIRIVSSTTSTTDTTDQHFVLWKKVEVLGEPDEEAEDEDGDGDEDEDNYDDDDGDGDGGDEGDGDDEGDEDENRNEDGVEGEESDVVEDVEDDWDEE